MNEKEFEQRLKETVAWCSRKCDLSKAQYLRTAALRPQNPDDTSLFLASSKQGSAAIEEVSQKRKKLLTKEGIQAVGTTSMAGGRLLAYFLGASGHDGLTESMSDGYFDHEDTPPWDTWVCCIAGKELIGPDQEPFDLRVVIGQRAFSADYVLSWVPPAWIENVGEVMRCETMGAIMWADLLVSRPAKYAVFDFHRCYVPAWLERYTTQLGR
ncbi:MAG: hypothetical protein EKK48_15065 [Candidatus Melainabacteria bacterium]|nr:MAG: hypothetical protein EKK48_15065 [Candidatus Melainabacteria bacterium]